METREMMPEAVAIWKAKLREFQLWEVRDAIAEFIGSRTREDARGVVLGDLTAILYVNRERRAREAAMGETQRNIARWQEEQKRDMEADPEGFEQAKAAFREKFKEIAKSKSMSQVGNQAAGIVDATDVKA